MWGGRQWPRLMAKPQGRSTSERRAKPGATYVGRPLVAATDGEALLLLRLVLPGTADQAILAALAADQDVLAATAAEAVVALQALELVVAAVADDHVGPLGPLDQLRPVIADDRRRPLGAAVDVLPGGIAVLWGRRGAQVLRRSAADRDHEDGAV